MIFVKHDDGQATLYVQDKSQAKSMLVPSTTTISK